MASIGGFGGGSNSCRERYGDITRRIASYVMQETLHELSFDKVPWHFIMPSTKTRCLCPNGYFPTLTIGLGTGILRLNKIRKPETIRDETYRYCISAGSTTDRE